MTETGSCYCGNVHYQLDITFALDSFQPRACDCDFCVKHGARYLSDPDGKLSIHIPASAKRVKQGNELAEFIVCDKCGVLVAVIQQHANGRVGVINSSTLDNQQQLQPSLTVSPKQLSADEKQSRWQQIWFNQVDFI